MFKLILVICYHQMSPIKYESFQMYSCGLLHRSLCYCGHAKRALAGRARLCLLRARSELWTDVVVVICYVYYCTVGELWDQRSSMVYLSHPY